MLRRVALPVLVLLATVPAAGAATRAVPVPVAVATGVPTLGPLAAGGGRVVFSFGASASVFDPATKSTVAAPGVPIPGGEVGTVRVSGSRAAYVASGAVVTGPLAGGAPVALPVPGCSGPARDLSLTGDVATWVVTGCSDGQDRVVAQDAGLEATPRALGLGAGLREPVVAGPWVSYVHLRADGIEEAVVASRNDGAVLYTVPVAASTAIADFQVGEDARSVLTTVGVGGSPLVSSVTPGNGSPFVIANGAALRLAKGRVLVDRTSTGGETLTVVSLDSTTTVVADFGPAARRVGAADFDGATVTFAQAEPAKAAVRAKKRACSKKQRKAKRCPKPIPGRAAVPARTVVETAVAR